ncbi:MAG: hypothetical protein J6K39_03770 [Clostridia bacterium]|nr:hypothetical protein [Clostridia bacterium]
MKKFNIVLMSLLTIVLSSVLAACSFKKVEATFDSSEVTLSFGESLNLDDHLSVQSVEKNEIVYHFSDSSLFDIVGRSVKAKKTGKSFVYATYEGNSLDSMELVVTKPFETPKNFSVDASGLLTWDAVSAFYGNESGPTTATYWIQGKKITYSKTDPSKAVITPINEPCNANSFQLEKGEYHITVKACARGYFSESLPSAEQTFKYGFIIDELKVEDLHWNGSELSWTAHAGAKYQVEFDGILLDSPQSANSKNLTSKFKSVSAGKHTLRVIVTDASTSSSSYKFPVASESLQIEKLATPTATSIDGKLEIGQVVNAENIVVELTGTLTETKTLETAEKISTNLEGLASGVYETRIVAKNENGLFFESDALNFGKIYKLGKVTLTGLGGNETNGNIVKMSVAGSSLIATELEILGEIYNGLSEDVTVRKLNVTLPDEAKVYDLEVVQKARNLVNLISGERVTVIDSDASETVKVTKLASVSGEIAHAYSEDQTKSIFTFDTVENATDYEIWVNKNSTYKKVENMTIDAEAGTATFAGRIEDLGFEGTSFDFQIVAKAGENDLYSISSSTLEDKTLSILSAPSEILGGDSTEKKISWEEISNAAKYKVQIFEIDKATYEQNKDSINLDEFALATLVESEVESTEYEFSEVGYYYVKIYSLSGDVNRYISSTTHAEKVLYVAEQLVLGEVSFGYDEAFKSEFTNASGYFLKIGNVDEIDSYDIEISTNNNFEKYAEDESIYLLTDDFSTVANIKIVGRSSDEILWLPTETYSLGVQRIAAVSSDDLLLAEDAKTLTVNAKTGVTRVVIRDGISQKVGVNGQPAVYDIPQQNVFILDFEQNGSVFDSATKTYEISNGMVYLDSRDSTFTFNRLTQPSDLRYENGKIKFTDNQVGDAEYFVLDVACVLPNGQTQNLSIRLANQVTVTYQGLSLPLGEQSNFVSTSSGEVTVNLDVIIALVKANPIISQYYSQSTKLLFSAYAYQNRFKDGVMQISSLYATTQKDVSATSLEIEKMKTTPLRYDAETNMLTWDAVSVDASVTAATNYTITSNAFDTAVQTSALAYDLSEINFDENKTFTFQISVTNANYLESNLSNSVEIYKLCAIDKVTLTNNSLTFTTAESKYDYVAVTFGNAEPVQNTTGSVEISEDGTYTLQLIGRTEEIKGTDENLTAIKYFLNSNVSTWTVADMETVKPENCVVDFDGNTISWNEFSSTLSVLEYVIVFEDKAGSVYTYVATNPASEVKDGETYYSVNIQTDAVLLENLSNLAAGDISIKLYAHIKPSYSVVANGTVYYHAENEAGFNYSPYNEGQTIKKLETPAIADVEFVYETDESSEDYLVEAKLPDIKVTFTGNYGAGVFKVYKNDLWIEGLSVTQEDDSYSFIITSDMYDNFVGAGETLKLSIRVVNEGDNASAIPSTAGSVEIVRANNLTSVEFVTNADGFVTHAVEMKFDEENVAQVLGGVVLKVDFTPAGGEAATKYVLAPNAGDATAGILTFDLTSFVDQNLAAGGTIKLSAFVNSYSNVEANTYYLVCPQYVQSSQLSVLKKVDNVTMQSGGFVVDNSLNSDNTIYTVICNDNDEMFILSKENDFTFRFPDDWANGTYSVIIFASEEGAISSASTTLDVKLSRIASITAVRVSRTSDTNEVRLSWDAVTDATGYLLNMYKDDELVYTFEASGNSYTLEQIFGNNYKSLTETGKISLVTLQNDMDVVFGVVTQGNSTANDSKEYRFNATIKGNSMQTSNIQVDEFGVLTFDSVAGNEYLYRFIAADGTILKTWNVVMATSEKTKIDTSSLEAGTSAFNLELIVKGSTDFDGETSSNNSNFVLDSAPYTTVGKVITLYKVEDIANVVRNEQISSDIAFEIVETFDKMFASSKADGILTGEAVEFVPEAYEEAYTFSLSTLIALLKESGIEITDSKIYFWQHKASEDSVFHVISKEYEFTFNYTITTEFVDVVKVGTNTGNANIEKDFINTFATFVNSDGGDTETIGMYARITQLSGFEGESGYAQTKYISKTTLLKNDYFGSSTFAINLTSLFEQDDLLSLYGEFKVEFSKVAVVGGVYALSPWEEAPQTFIRLNPVDDIALVNGSMRWTNDNEHAEKFLVFFVSTLENEVVMGSYFYHETERTTYDPTNYISTGHKYYLGVRSINSNPYILSSKIVYISNEDGAMQIYKNQISSPLKIESGAAYINWTKSGDFVSTLTSESGYSEIADLLASEVFVSPFTFSLQDLVDGNVKVRFKFTSTATGAQGLSKSFDVNAIDLLPNLYKFGIDNGLYNLEERLRNVYTNAQSTDVRRVISGLQQAIENGSYGVANSRLLFDKYFETLQTGEYALQYCLLGNNKSLTSGWYDYSNNNGENLIYVNSEPQVAVIREPDPDNDMITSYKVRMKKSEVYAYDATNGAVLQETNNYIMTLGGFTFALNTSSMTLTRMNVETATSVTVYEEDVSGTTYVYFYINYNGGDSLLGVYGDDIYLAKDENLTMKMEIFAVGNNFSMSSKSKQFSVTFLKIANMKIDKGVFSWDTDHNRMTSVYVQRTDGGAETEVKIDASKTTSIFSLEGKGAGIYTVKFIIKGEVRDNVVYIDSGIDQIDRIFKLEAPGMNNDNGFIGITSGNNATYLSYCYSSENLFAYNIYNENSISKGLSVDIFDTRSDKTLPLYYEVGVTGMDETKAGFDPVLYEYKLTEEFASVFYALSMGSTAELSFLQDPSEYYLTKITHDSGKNLAVRSEVTTFAASMLDSVKNVRIENGILKWDEVAGRGGDNPLAVPETEGTKVVYKITIEQYTSNLEDGKTSETTFNQCIKYTAENYFDFAVLKEGEVGYVEGSFIKATVQALTLNVSEEEIVGADQLVEGGWLYGNVQFVDSERYILMGNGSILKGIDRLKAVEADMIGVVEGKLTWDYVTSKDIATVEMFNNAYAFIVETEDGEEIAGQFEVTLKDDTAEDSNTFGIIFSENLGEMSVGTYNIVVFVTQGQDNPNKVIKSFGCATEITKLATVASEHFEIISDSQTETLSLEKYFANYPENSLVLSYGENQITLTKDTFKLFIVASEADIVNSYPAGYYAACLIVGEDDALALRFMATKAGTIFSDLSDDFVLKRSPWEAEQSISWDEEKQEFSWNYDYYSFSTKVEAEEKRYAYLATETVSLFNDSGLTESTQLLLEEGEEFEMIDTLEGTISVRIKYKEVMYYISRSAYEHKIVDVLDEDGNTVVETMDGSSLFKVVEEVGEYSIVESEGRYFKVQSSAIVTPTFYVEATYANNVGGNVETISVRTYTTQDRVFRPTIVCNSISLVVRVKLNNASIQSKELVFDGSVAFNLFASGDGTSMNPYVIENADQFRNIAYRQTKDDMLVEFVEQTTIGSTVVTNTNMEESKYYFIITKDLDLGEIDGILFKGEFTGVIDGLQDNTTNTVIAYTSTGVTALSSSVTIRAEDSNVNTSTPAVPLNFKRGSAIFENLNSSAIIKNIDIDATYGNSLVDIKNHSLVAGLVITNGGRIENVNLTGFRNNFVGNISTTERTIMAYSGVVAINQGNNAIVTGCQLSTSMSLDDSGSSQLVFVGGICYTNYATIENCVASTEGGGQTISVNCQEGSSAIQIGGIVVTSTSSSILRNCTNNMNISATSSVSGNSIVAYIAGVADRVSGSFSDLSSTGVIATVGLNVSNITKSDLIAVIL